MSEPLTQEDFAKQGGRILDLEERLHFALDALRDALKEYRQTYIHNPKGRNEPVLQNDPQWVRMAREALEVRGVN